MLAIPVTHRTLFIAANLKCYGIVNQLVDNCVSKLTVSQGAKYKKKLKCTNA